MLSRGRSAEVYDWGDNAVLKLFYDGVSLDWVESEATITDTVHKSGLPVPEVFDTIEWNRRQGIVFEKIDGISMLDACIEKPQDAGAHGRSLAKLHREIHDTTIETLPDQLTMLNRVAGETKYLDTNQKQAVLDFLARQAEGFQLIHMDFHPDQVLFTKNGPCIIDWETACRGSPLSDVARSTLILRIGAIPRPTGISVQGLAKIRNALISGYLEQYFGIPGGESSDDMAFWELIAAVVRMGEEIDGEEQQLEQIIASQIEECGVI